MDDPEIGGQAGEEDGDVEGAAMVGGVDCRPCPHVLGALNLHAHSQRREDETRPGAAEGPREAAVPIDAAAENGQGAEDQRGENDERDRGDGSKRHR